MLELITKQMLRKGFEVAAQTLIDKWASLNLYEKKRIYYGWHYEWPAKEIEA